MKNFLFFLTRYPGVGGIESVTHIIVNALSNQGFDIDIVANTSQPNDAQKDTLAKIIRLPLERYDADENTLFLKKILEQGDYGCVIYQDSYAPNDMVVIRACKESGTPLIVFDHNSPKYIANKRRLDPIWKPIGLMRRMLHPYLLFKDRQRKRNLLNHSNRYILLSQKFIPEFCKVAGIKGSDKISAINNPSLPIFTDNQRERRNRILFVGRIIKTKGVFKILKIWENVCTLLPDWEMVFVGDGPEKQRLEEYCHSNKIPRVSFVGVSNPWPYYQSASLFLMASKFEGLPMTLVEASACGCIPIAEHSFSSLTDIIEPDQSGIILPKNASIEMWKEAILGLIKNPQEMEVMRSNAVKKADSFSIDSTIKKWEELLSQF